MSIANYDLMRDIGNLTNAVEDDALAQHLTRGEKALKRYLSRDVYNGIVGRYDDSWTNYESDFSSGADDWEQNAGDSGLQVTGNNDSILGLDDVLKVYANGSDIDMRIKDTSNNPQGGKSYLIKFDYYAEENSGLAYLGIEIDGEARARDPFGEYAAHKIIEERWVIGATLEFLGSGNLYLTGYTDAVNANIDALASGKAIYFKNIVVTISDEYASLQRAEALWALSFAYPYLAVHTAGRGLAISGGAGEGSYQYISVSDARQLAKEVLGEAMDEINQYRPTLDIDEDTESEGIDISGMGLIAVSTDQVIEKNPRISY